MSVILFLVVLFDVQRLFLLSDGKIKVFHAVMVVVVEERLYVFSGPSALLSLIIHNLTTKLDRCQFFDLVFEIASVSSLAIVMFQFKKFLI